MSSFFREQFRWIQEHLDRWFHIMVDLYGPARNTIMTHYLWLIIESKNRMVLLKILFMLTFCSRDICQWRFSRTLIYCKDLTLWHRVYAFSNNWWFATKMAPAHREKRHWKNLASILTSIKLPVSYLTSLPVVLWPFFVKSNLFRSWNDHFRWI